MRPHSGCVRCPRTSSLITRFHSGLEWSRRSDARLPRGGIAPPPFRNIDGREGRQVGQTYRLALDHELGMLIRKGTCGTTENASSTLSVLLVLILDKP